MRRLVPNSLARRFAYAAAALGAAALLVTVVASLWLIDRQQDRALQQLALRERQFHAETVGGNLRALAERMGEIANSTILATGLVDSAGRETYLVPFLAGIRQVNGLPVQVLFTDFEGKEIAGNGAGRFDEEELAWLRQRLLDGTAAATIRPLAAGGHALLGMEPMRYARTSSPEGAVLYRVRLAEIRLPPAMRLEWGAPADAQAASIPATAVAAPDVFRPLGLRVRGPLTPPVAAVASGPAFLAVVLGGLAVFVLLAWAGLRVAGYLTRDVTALEAFSRRVVQEGLGAERAAVAGSAEVASLARSINEMLDRLAGQQATLIASARRKDEFLAMLAHELRNPLAPISTGAELLRLRGGNDPRVVHTSDIIARQARHMTKIVDDLLDVSRVTRGLVRIERGTVDLATVLLEAMDQARPLMELRRHALAVEMPEAKVFVSGDHARLLQVVGNLLNNAAKYTQPGGHISLSLEADAETARIVVRDDGHGIAADLMPEIFDLFTQGQRSADRAQGGLGLGLALVRNLVELHGGQVVAESAGEGRGSTFTVTLPRLDVARGMAAGEAPPDARAHRELAILVVDDNQDAAETLSMLLRLSGHRIDVAHDGESALARARQAPYDAFILDVGLPGMSGIELAGRLRQLPSARGAAYVALTGYGQAADREQTAAAGFDRHLVKPVDAAALLQVLAEIADRLPSPAIPRQGRS